MCLLIADLYLSQCSSVHNVKGNMTQCKFVQTVDSCKNEDGFIVYLEFIYCMLPHNLIPLAMAVLVSRPLHLMGRA